MEQAVSTDPHFEQELGHEEEGEENNEEKKKKKKMADGRGEEYKEQQEKSRSRGQLAAADFGVDWIPGTMMDPEKRRNKNNLVIVFEYTPCPNFIGTLSFSSFGTN